MTLSSENLFFSKGDYTKVRRHPPKALDKVADRKPGFHKDQGLLTLHDSTPSPIILYAQLKVQKLLWKIKCRPCSPKLSIPMSFFLSPSG